MSLLSPPFYVLISSENVVIWMLNNPTSTTIRFLSKYLVPSYRYCSGRLWNLWDCGFIQQKWVAHSGPWVIACFWFWLTVCWSETWGASATGSQHHTFSATVDSIPLYCKSPESLCQLFCYSDKKVADIWNTCIIIYRNAILLAIWAPLSPSKLMCRVIQHTLYRDFLSSSSCLGDCWYPRSLQHTNYHHRWQQMGLEAWQEGPGDLNCSLKGVSSSFSIRCSHESRHH